MRPQWAGAARLESIVPLAMELVALDGQFREFLVGHFDPRRIVALVELRLDAQSLGGRGVADQVDHDLAADQRSTTPVLGDVAKHPMLDLVPLAGAGREVTDLDDHPQVVGQFLQLDAPETNAIAVAAAAVGGDQQATRGRVERLAHLAPPPADALDRKFGRVVGDADAHPALVGHDVIHTIRERPCPVPDQ